jgi:hypothetical protein
VSEIARATRVALGEAPAGRDAEALAAFLCAWRSHWPESYATALGEDAEHAHAWAERAALDPGRHVKLRRIAIENLARVL